MFEHGKWRNNKTIAVVALIFLGTKRSVNHEATLTLESSSGEPMLFTLKPGSCLIKLSHLHSRQQPT